MRCVNAHGRTRGCWEGRFKSQAWNRMGGPELALPIYLKLVARLGYELERS